MKSVIFYLLVLSSYCYCEQLLGGWSTSEDESLKSDCLHKALVHLNGAQVNDEIQAQASDLTCKIQIVNGLNIKCSFVWRGEKWQCSYYKSFVQTLETQLEQCKKAEDEPKPEANGNEQVTEDQETSDEGGKEEQPLVANENDDEELVSAPVTVSETEKQVAQESPVSDNAEEDDEAAVDTMKQKMSEQSANNEGEQQ